MTKAKYIYEYRQYMHASISRVRYLEHPSNDDYSCCKTFFVIPDNHGGLSTFLRCELWGRVLSMLHHGLLGSRISLAASIVGRPQPPSNGEEDGPGSGKDVVGEKQVSEITYLFGILL